MSAKHFPHSVYYQMLIPLMEENGFELISREDKQELNASRFLTSFALKRRKPQHLVNDRQNKVLANIHMIGIPMGSIILLIHAIIDNEESVKIKLKMNDSQESMRHKIMNELIIKVVEMVSISINDLPLELKFKIMSLLTIESLLKMAQVSSTWREITLDDELWRILLKRHFPQLYSRGLDGNHYCNQL